MNFNPSILSTHLVQSVQMLQQMHMESVTEVINKALFLHLYDLNQINQTLFLRFTFSHILQSTLNKKY